KVSPWDWRVPWASMTSPETAGQVIFDQFTHIVGIRAAKPANSSGRYRSSGNVVEFSRTLCARPSGPYVRQDEPDRAPHDDEHEQTAVRDRRSAMSRRPADEYECDREADGEDDSADIDEQRRCDEGADDHGGIAYAEAAEFEAYVRPLRRSGRKVLLCYADRRRRDTADENEVGGEPTTVLEAQRSGRRGDETARDDTADRHRDERVDRDGGVRAYGFELCLTRHYIGLEMSVSTTAESSIASRPCRSYGTTIDSPSVASYDSDAVV